jgi:hypothetical protein
LAKLRRARLVDGTEVLQETGRINRKTEDGKLQVMYVGKNRILPKESMP